MEYIKRIGNWIWKLTGNKTFVTAWLAFWIAFCTWNAKWIRRFATPENSIEQLSNRLLLCAAGLGVILAYQLKGTRNVEDDQNKDELWKSNANPEPPRRLEG